MNKKILALSVLTVLISGCNSTNDKETSASTNKEVNLYEEIKNIAPLNLDGVKLLDYRQEGNLYIARVSVSQGGREDIVPVSITTDLRMVTIGQTYDTKTGATIGSIDMNQYKKLAAFSYTKPEKDRNDFFIFTDPDCTYCKRLSEDLKKNDLMDYANLYVYFLPLESIHPDARKKCEYILSLDPKKRAKAMEDLEANKDDWKAYKENKDISAKLDEMIELAELLGVQGTPSIYDKSANQVDTGIFFQYMTAMKNLSKDKNTTVKKD